MEYLGSDLIAALAGLKMHYLAHAGYPAALISRILPLAAAPTDLPRRSLGGTPNRQISRRLFLVISEIRGPAGCARTPKNGKCGTWDANRARQSRERKRPSTQHETR